MNYYERHLGDYARDTGHLSLLEHGVYTLLLDRYYATESAIPADQVHRVCRARTRDERDAVDAVLQEFFTLQDGNWHSSRCDAELEKFQESEPERLAKRENAKERQRRARQRRADLFDALRKLDIVPSFETKTSDLESMLSRATSQPVTRDVTPPVTRDNTAIQTPDTRHQTPEDQEPASHSSTAEPSTDQVGQGGSPPADLKLRRAQRLAQITDDAIETFNASALVKPNGGLLATVSPKVGREKRQQQIARCLRTAKAICAEDYDSQTITREFLADYWTCCAEDDHKSGRRGGGKDHADWLPSFEYLTREKTMLEVYDRVKAEAAA